MTRGDGLTPRNWSQNDPAFPKALCELRRAGLPPPALPLLLPPRLPQVEHPDARVRCPPSANRSTRTDPNVLGASHRADRNHHRPRPPCRRPAAARTGPTSRLRPRPPSHGGSQRPRANAAKPPADDAGPHPAGRPPAPLHPDPTRPPPRRAATPVRLRAWRASYAHRWPIKFNGLPAALAQLGLRHRGLRVGQQSGHQHRQRLLGRLPVPALHVVDGRWPGAAAPALVALPGLDRRPLAHAFLAISVAELCAVVKRELTCTYHCRGYPFGGCDGHFQSLRAFDAHRVRRRMHATRRRCRGQCASKPAGRCKHQRPPVEGLVTIWSLARSLASDKPEKWTQRRSAEAGA